VTHRYLDTLRNAPTTRLLQHHAERQEQPAVAGATVSMAMHSFCTDTSLMSASSEISLAPGSPM
jgi:hypothetical protein